MIYYRQRLHLRENHASISSMDELNKNPKKILLVEDDDSLASVYLTRLEAEGFTVKRVPNGEEALAATIAFRPDLILLDVMMP